MKKVYLFAVALILIIVVGLFAKVFTGRMEGYQASVRAIDGGGVLKLENAENADVKIIVAKTNKITIDLGGVEEEQAKRISFFKADKGTTQLDLASSWWGNNATITVPEGTLIDVGLGKNKSLSLDDSTLEGADNFWVDTSSVDMIIFDANGVFINGDGSGEVSVWDPDAWNLFDFFADSEEGSDNAEEESSDEEYTPPTCGVGSQAIRNYCCENVNDDTEVPVCDGYGYWFFNNVLRSCDYGCDPAGEEEWLEELNEENEDAEDNEDNEEYDDCSVGSQLIRNVCCQNQNMYSEGADCVGEWRYDNSLSACYYHCFTTEELQSYYSGETNGDSENATTDDFCGSFSSQKSRDECCDYHLGNPLSIGPHPGFPDCVGKWYFNTRTQLCDFRCADHKEMVEILKELEGE